MQSPGPGVGLCYFPGCVGRMGGREGGKEGERGHVCVGVGEGEGEGSVREGEREGGMVGQHDRSTDMESWYMVPK